MLAIKVIATVLLWLLAVASAKVHVKKLDSPTVSERTGVYLGMIALYGFITYAVWV